MALRVGTFEVLGVGIDALTRRSAIDAVKGLVKDGDHGYLVFCTVSTVLEVRNDEQGRRSVAEATLVTPDGMPLVWLGRRAGYPVERVYGPDFMVELIEATGSELRHFFYGGAPGVAAEMATRLQERFPGLVVAGSHSPPMGLDPFDVPDDEIKLINSAKADIVWIGLGHPKQDLFMYANQGRIAAPVMAGVGAAFDFHSGRKKEAPEWMKRSGLQWLHRLLSEPRRLWKRYLIGNMTFVFLLVKDWMGRKLSRRTI